MRREEGEGGGSSQLHPEPVSTTTGVLVAPCLDPPPPQLLAAGSPSPSPLFALVFTVHHSNIRNFCWLPRSGIACRNIGSLRGIQHTERTGGKGRGQEGCRGTVKIGRYLGDGCFSELSHRTLCVSYVPQARRFNGSVVRRTRRRHPRGATVANVSLHKQARKQAPQSQVASLYPADIHPTPHTPQATVHININRVLRAASGRRYIPVLAAGACSAVARLLLLR